jgi:hypothetical protein
MMIEQDNDNVSNESKQYPIFLKNYMSSRTILILLCLLITISTLWFSLLYINHSQIKLYE